MTADQAEVLMGRLLAAFPNWNAPGATQQLYLDHLTPLPFERGSAGVDNVIASATFPPSVGELMLACGVDSQEGRDALKRAIASGRQLLRDFRSPCGWRVEGEEIEQPAMPTRMQARRIGELMHASLGPGDLRRAIAGPSTAMAPARPVQLLDQDTLQRRTGELHERAQNAIELYEQEAERLRRARLAIVTEARGLAELRTEAEEALVGGEVPGSLVKVVAEKLLRRLADDIDEGRIACVEVLAAACFPGLEVRELKQLPDDEDPTTVRIVLKRKPE